MSTRRIVLTLSIGTEIRDTVGAAVPGGAESIDQRVRS